jgi:hypothetical protein
MKQFAIILLVLIFALAGKSQNQNFTQEIKKCGSVSFINGNQTCENPIIGEDFCYDGQETNDMDGFDAVCVLPDLYHLFQFTEIKKFATVFSTKQLIQVGELLLDLPPPSLSV